MTESVILNSLLYSHKHLDKLIECSMQFAQLLRFGSRYIAGSSPAFPTNRIDAVAAVTSDNKLFFKNDFSKFKSYNHLGGTLPQHSYSILITGSGGIGIRAVIRFWAPNSRTLYQIIMMPDAVRSVTSIRTTGSQVRVLPSPP